MIHLLLATLATSGSYSHPSFTFHGSYVEACSCSAPCLCELTGPEHGCQGVGAFNIEHATLGSGHVHNVKAAYALGAGSWVVIYIDSPASEMKTTEKFMRNALAGFGPVVAVKKAKISMVEHGGVCTAMVDSGSIMKFTTKPMMGGDGVHALEFGNIHDKVHPSVMQATVTACSFHDGSRSFTLKDSNAVFNDHIHSSGVF